MGGVRSKKFFDEIRRNSYLNGELKYIRLKAIVRDRRLPYSLRQFAYFKLINFGRVNSRVRFRNRCIITFRSGFILRDFHLSRIKFRELALNGLLPGVSKASW